MRWGNEIRPRGRWPRQRRLVLGAVIALLAATTLSLSPTPAQADPGDVGSQGPSHTGTGTPTGTKRPESVLWFNDGLWWGNLWDTASRDFHIFRYDPSASRWVDTGVTTETRANTHHDVLWDGTTLYVASHAVAADGVPASAGFPSTLRRYSYDPATRTYRLVSTSQINNMKTEELVIDKDSTGRLWATWQQDNQIWVNNTDTDGTTWGTPFALPGGAVTPDDISSVIAFGHGKMGLMFDREGASTSDPTAGFYWSVHVDGADRTAWSTPAPVATGARFGDDHLNLKWLDSAGGRVFAAVKTSFVGGSQPLIDLLSMDSTGTWTVTPIATVSECPDRVVVLIDEAAQQLRTFATYPKPSGTTNAGTCSTSGGAIYEKDSPLADIHFTAQKTLRILDADQYVHNVSSTKQNLNHAATDGTSTVGSGVMAIADVNATSTYWYYYEPPAGADTTAPDTTISSGPTGTTTATDASFAFTSTEPGSTFACALDGAAFTSCTSPRAYTGLAAGDHTFAVRATDAAGNTDPTPATQGWTVQAPADTTPPDTTISSGPSGTTTATDASFAFTSTEPGSTFACALDGAAFTSCTSPRAYTGLAVGDHTFAVRATDAAGNTDPTPATQGWTVAAASTGIVRGAVSSATNSTATTSLTIAQPAGVTAGDVLVSCLSLSGANVTSTGVPSGWTAIASGGSVTNPRVFGYYKVATSTEPASYTWKTTSSAGGGAIVRYSGASGVDATAATGSGAAATSGTVPGVTTSTSGVMLVGCLSINSSTATLNAPTGMSQVVETGERRFEVDDALQAGSGPTGARTWTFSASREWSGWLVGLRPQ